MSLVKYNEKCDFKQTTEPVGETKSFFEKLIFVVRKYGASHLDYDFRLEPNRVILSWAVLKELCLDYVDRRLAPLVVNHPYDYKDFEGEIFKRN